MSACFACCSHGFHCATVHYDVRPRQDPVTVVTAMLGFVSTLLSLSRLAVKAVEGPITTALHFSREKFLAWREHRAAMAKKRQGKRVEKGEGATGESTSLEVALLTIKV